MSYSKCTIVPYTNAAYKQNFVDHYHEWKVSQFSLNCFDGDDIPVQMDVPSHSRPLHPFLTTEAFLRIFFDRLGREEKRNMAMVCKGWSKWFLIGTEPKFKYQENGTYIVTRFNEVHNHPLASPESTIFLKGNRKITEVQKQFVTKVKVLKLGGVKAYRGWKELCGGYDNIGATEVDFKNFARDIKTYIGNFDAQMFVENLIGRKDTCSSFYFDFIVDENKCLAGVFWADPICIKNYIFVREQWIPAYFKYVSMSGLMRVTSRSESENSLFDRFLTPHLTLVEFWVRYESALEAQRHKQSKLNSENKHSEIPRKTKSNLKVHASEMYSHNIFKDFLTELVAALSDCRFKDVEKIDETKIYILTDLKMRNKSWNVAYSPDNMEITCSCSMF
ncbi:uncharacterized protein LOC141619421 [Silene latifolia]|uniref:uncharacterized protein LOC141619421 n=1 Tax=Silene latifolia TaxID=37657 RepID=UPI003D771F5C